MSASLFECLDRFDLAHEVSYGYVYQLSYAISRLGRFLGRVPTIDDLRADAINRWLKHERETGEISDRSRANVRTSILTIWQRFGADFNRSAIRSVIVTPKNPEAWHYDELEKVAKAALRLEGVLPNNVPRALHMSTTLWFAYETGLRRGDIWRFNFDAFDDELKAAVTQGKTRRVHTISITPETDDGIRRIRSILKFGNSRFASQPLRWPQSISQFYYWMKQCRILAGVEPETRNRSLQHVRRTAATQVDTEGNHAWRFLGHSREGLDRKAYIDARKCVRPTMPIRNRANYGDQH